MLAETPSRMLTEWAAFAGIEPFGEERADLRAAIVARTIAEVNRDIKKRREPFEVSEFMPRFDQREEGGQEFGEMPVEQQIAFVEWINAAYGGKDLRHADNR